MTEMSVRTIPVIPSPDVLAIQMMLFVMMGIYAPSQIFVLGESVCPVKPTYAMTSTLAQSTVVKGRRDVFIRWFPVMMEMSAPRIIAIFNRAVFM